MLNPNPPPSDPTPSVRTKVHSPETTAALAQLDQEFRAVRLAYVDACFEYSNKHYALSGGYPPEGC